MRGPRDGVGLAGPGRVLDQVTPARRIVGDRLDELLHRAPLMISREHQRGGPHDLAGGGVLVGLGLEEHLRAEDGQPVVALQDLLPQVGRGGSVRVLRVACSAGVLVTSVERKEVGLLPRKLGGHVDLVVVDGEVHEGAGAEAEQRLPCRVPIVAVLADGSAPLLLKERLELDGRNRKAVDEENQVNRARVPALR